MTTPTQAQIAIGQFISAIDAARNKFVDALTATAQVGEPEYSKLQGRYERDMAVMADRIERLKSAAQVGETTYQDAILGTLMSIEILLKKILQRIGDLDGRGD